MNDSRYSILRSLCGERNRVDSAVELGWRWEELFGVGRMRDCCRLSSFSTTSSSSTKSSE